MKFCLLLSTILLAMLALSCSPAQIQQVESVSTHRETVCALVSAWHAKSPELTRLHQLCEAGADLKEVAAAYAGCPADGSPTGPSPNVDSKNPQGEPTAGGPASGSPTGPSQNVDSKNPQGEPTVGGPADGAPTGATPQPSTEPLDTIQPPPPPPDGPSPDANSKAP